MGLEDASRFQVADAWQAKVLRWQRTAATGFAILFLLLTIGYWIFYTAGPRLTDFMSYWAAGKLASAGTPALAYDIPAHREVQEAVLGEFRGRMPFPYPPPFLFFVLPFSIPPYVAAFGLWVAATGALYLAVSRSVVRGPYALAHPPALLNGLIGQNGFLTFSIFVAGANRLREQPFTAGLILGLLVIKPQLAALLPIAVLASRNWRAIGGAVISASGLLLLALLAFGVESYRGFLELMPLYSGWMAENKWPWEEFASPFAFLRFLGIPATIGLAVQGVLLAGAAVLTWVAWSEDWKEKVPILAAASLLVSPYLLTYDALLLLVPMGLWISEQRRPRAIALIWICCWLPIAHFLKLYDGPNTIPIAALLALGFLVADRVASAGPKAHVRPALQSPGLNTAEGTTP